MNIAKINRLKNSLLLVVGSIVFMDPVLAGQGIVQEIWRGLPGRDLGALIRRIEGQPLADEARIVSKLDIGRMGKNYGTRYSTWVVPPETGDYRFWIAADDCGELWLSTDESPDNVKKIAYLTGFRSRRSWGGGSGRSELIRLEKGKKYYLRALHFNAGGGNHMSVAWQGPGVRRGALAGDSFQVPKLDGKTAALVQSIAQRERKLDRDLQELAAGDPGKIASHVKQLGEEDLKILSHQLNELADRFQRHVSQDDLHELERFVKMARGLSPSPEQPIANPVLKRLLQLEEIYLKNLSFEQLVKLGAHRSAGALGTIPMGAHGGDRTVRMHSRKDKSGEEMVSTGLYALPGKPVTISVPPALAGKKLSVQIGHHLRADDNRHPELYSMPDTTRRFPISEKTMQVISPHGGLILIWVPARVELKESLISFSGVIDAPRFVLGETTNEQWRETRDSPGAWGELVSEHLVLVAHREALRDLDNPHELMTWWDEQVRAQHEFYNHTPGKPFRMHATYYEIIGVSTWPLYYKKKGMRDLLNLKQMKVFPDGLYLHEHGHHCDNGKMIFGKLGESTPNWGGYYMRETMGGFVWKDSPQSHISQLLDSENKLHLGLQKDQWWNTQWTHHWSFPTTSIMVGYAHTFGWEAFKRCVRRFTFPDDKINKMYAKLGKEQWSNAHKIDRWLIFMSEESGHDVRPYMDHFFLRPTENAAAYIDKLNLPKWDLVYAPDWSVSTPAGKAVNIPSPLTHAKTLGSDLKLKWTQKPKHGTFSTGSDGNFTYTPKAGFAGSDAVHYAVTNEFGNKVEGKVGFAVVPVGSEPKLTAGSIDSLENGTWKKISFPKPYREPILVAAAKSGQKNTAVVQVRNLNSNGAEIMVQQSDPKKKIVTHTVNWMVLESGAYSRAKHGIKARVSKIEQVPEAVSHHMTGASFSWAGQTDLFGYSRFGQVLTSNNPVASQFYTEVDKADIGLHIGCHTGTVEQQKGLKAETVGVVLLEPGLYQLGGQEVSIKGSVIRVGDISLDLEVTDMGTIRWWHQSALKKLVRTKHNASH